MPELPEVETTRRGLVARLCGTMITELAVRERRLRWPVERKLSVRLRGARIRAIERRGKYLLVDCGGGWLILHLGMSGSLRILPQGTPAGRHDHVDFLLANGQLLRLTDPRRFGAVLWAGSDPLSHPLLAHLAPEPLEAAFTAEWLHARLAGRKAAIKSLLMDGHIVTGVGNIYAAEALFRARIHPATPGRRLGPARCARLVEAIRKTLQAAIAAGGSTLRDFVAADGRPGYFQQEYYVYGRAGQRCRVCGTRIRSLRQGQRATFYCPRCQRF
ncbi:MAG TPA: bifunctional DNA-formamidopyrimidine glycosylase/DNA-(apurinic or apyrimidinic site) lyase [Burkholderiales bacterium]|jgi:formamidopyrimidine-DNA glycosylase|nr:bifunctional DNA-formamidopyrimidine glycosylase/DNA-(apurinic or apyrimidinic site) lyase [Burkholderiales bacterium]